MCAPGRYNFYHSDGLGRDSFIQHVSQHQTSFNYVPKTPECARRRGVARLIARPRRDRDRAHGLA